MGGRKGSSCSRLRRVACCAYWGRTAGGPGSRRGHYGHGCPGQRRGPAGHHLQNAQNEPALAVDPTVPDILAAGANDLVDMQPCSQKASTTAGACSFLLGTFNLGVGLTGLYFSFDSGHSWIQPTYQGLTMAGCSPAVMALDLSGTALSGRPRAGPGDGNPGAAFGERPTRGCGACPPAEPRQLPVFLFVRCSIQVNKFRRMWTARCTIGGPRPAVRHLSQRRHR